MICTAYFNHLPDPQRKSSWPADDYHTIRSWHHSIDSLGLKAVLFHNAFSPDFVDRYTTPNIRFIRVDPGPYLPNDCRWGVYARYLADIDDDYILLTDCCDVTVLQDPFEFITAEDKLYIGDEATKRRGLKTIGGTRWMLNCFDTTGPGDIRRSLPDLRNKPVLNCGIVGGSRKTIRFYVETAARLIQECNPVPEAVAKQKVQIIDMAVANYIGYVMLRGEVIHGHPLHNRFKLKDTRTDVYIRHK